jgi:hypothetical protein
MRLSLWIGDDSFDRGVRSEMIFLTAHCWFTVFVNKHLELCCCLQNTLRDFNTSSLQKEIEQL